MKKAVNRAGSTVAVENITITLDALSSKMVRLYAAENDRSLEDVANGVIGGNLGHAMGRGNCDDSLEHTREYVMDAIGRRRLSEAKGGRPKPLPLGGAGLSQTERAILHLQGAVAERFGRNFGTDSGRGTIYISHDGVSLTDRESGIVAQRVSSIARHLTITKVCRALK